MPLIELRELSVREGEQPRRVFLSADLALTIWFSSPGVPSGFELVYDREGRPHAVSRRPKDEHPAHFAVDDGDIRPGRPKRSPVLGESTRPIPPDMVDRFSSQAVNLEEPLCKYCITAIEDALAWLQPHGSHS